MAEAADSLVESMLAANIPKLGILVCLLLSLTKYFICVEERMKIVRNCSCRLWNSEVPIAPRWSCVDLFSGTGQVKVGNETCIVCDIR